MVLLSKVNTARQLRRSKYIFILVVFLVFYHNIDYFLDYNSIVIHDTSTLSLFYRHADNGRNSSYPFISGDTFRAFADHIYDETKEKNLTSIIYGDIVFVKTDKLKNFFSSAYPFINTSFVLVTHNSDDPAPTTYRTYLSDPKILKWYASNPSELNHSKISPIPIGLANARWAHGNVNIVLQAMKNHRKSWHNRTVLLYVNFDVSTNKDQRTKALAQIHNITNVQHIQGRVSLDKYYEQIGNVKFVLSPPGNGLDCHRTWEALVMGAVPIVLRSTLDPLFKNTRTVIIDDWSQLTNDYLFSLDFSKNDDILPAVIYADHWRKEISQIKSSHNIL